MLGTEGTVCLEMRITKWNSPTHSAGAPTMPMQAQAGTARIATFLAISNTNHHPTHSGGRDVATRNLGIREATKGVKVMKT